MAATTFLSKVNVCRSAAAAAFYLTGLSNRACETFFGDLRYKCTTSKFISRRSYSENANKIAASGSKAPQAPVRTGGNVYLRYYPNGWDKFVLVMVKKYPSMNEIPEYVSTDVMTKARDKSRIYFGTAMMIATLFGCIAMIQIGKKRARQGESVQKMNEDWHKKMAADMVHTK